jgi:hypothetical protein
MKHKKFGTTVLQNTLNFKPEGSSKGIKKMKEDQN